MRFNVATNPTHTPLPSEFSFKPNEKQCDPKFRQKYQQLVGSLMYLMIGAKTMSIASQLLAILLCWLRELLLG